MHEALFNIQKLAETGYDPATMNATRRTYAAISQISCINYQEVKDPAIAGFLCDIHDCPGIRLRNIAWRAGYLLEVARG